MATIAIQDQLSPFVAAVKAAGFQVVSLSEARRPDVVAVVVSGMEENMLGDERIAVDRPVIDAKGQTPEQVVAQIHRLNIH